MFFSKFAAVLALASFTFALPRPHDACPGLVAHDGDGACFTLDRRQMDHGSMPGMDMPAPSPTPAPMDHGSMHGIIKRHGPDGDEAEMAMPVPAASPLPVPVVAVPAPVVAPKPEAPMYGHGHGAAKRHDACPGLVNHDGDGAC